VYGRSSGGVGLTGTVTASGPSGSAHPYVPQPDAVHDTAALPETNNAPASFPHTHDVALPIGSGAGQSEGRSPPTALTSAYARFVVDHGAPSEATSPADSHADAADAG
jgi:hypothetical protein